MSLNDALMLWTALMLTAVVVFRVRAHRRQANPPDVEIQRALAARAIDRSKFTTPDPAIEGTLHDVGATSDRATAFRELRARILEAKRGYETSTGLLITEVHVHTLTHRANGVPDMTTITDLDLKVSGE